MTEFIYANGKFIGSTNETNLPTGKGIFTYHNGDVYEGEFENGQRNGNGTYYYK